MSAKKNAIKKSERALRVILPAMLRTTEDSHAERLAAACERLDFAMAAPAWTSKACDHPLVALVAKLWLDRIELVCPGVNEQYRLLFIQRVFDTLREIQKRGGFR